MKTSFFVTAVFAVTFGALAGLGLILGAAKPLPHGEVTIMQLPDEGAEPVRVAQTDFRPRRPY